LLWSPWPSAWSGSLTRAWVPLWYASFAKHRGNFDAIDNGGFPAETFTTLTGQPADVIRASDSFGRRGEDKLWRELVRGVARRDVIVLTTKGEDSTDYHAAAPAALEGSPFAKSRLVDGHAYGVLDVFEKHGQRFVRVLNPWRFQAPRNEDGSSGHPPGVGVITFETYVAAANNTTFGRMANLHRRHP